MEFFVKGVFDFLFAFFVSLAFLPFVYNMVKKLKAKQI